VLTMIVINQNTASVKLARIKLNATQKNPKVRAYTIKCCKYFYAISCLGNHIANKKCIEYSYMCKKCHRFYKTRLKVRRSQML